MGSSGAGSGSQTNFSTPPTVPKWLKPYYENTASQLEAAQGQLPSISSLYGSVPLLDVAGLGQGELTDIAGFQNAAANPMNSLETAGGAGLNNFIGTPGQPSAATQAGLQEFNQLQAPAILQQAALQGQGNSGAALAALAQGQAANLTPMLEADQTNSLTAAQSAGQLGLGEASQLQTDLSNALQAAGLPREVADQQAQALYNQQQQQWQFGSNIQTGGQGQFPSLIGGGLSIGNFNSATPKF